MWRTGSARAANCGVIQPLDRAWLARHPDVGIGVRPARPAGVPGRRADVADLRTRSSWRPTPRGLATSGAVRRRRRTNGELSTDDIDDDAELEAPPVRLERPGGGIAQWIYDGRDGRAEDGRSEVSGLGWLRQPTSYSDREWILSIAQQYRQAERRRVRDRVAEQQSGDDFAEGAGQGRARGLIVQMLLATQLVDLVDDVLLRLDGQADGARRNTRTPSSRIFASQVSSLSSFS